jgi:S-adenosylmethionine:tRNA ribosyltransferase-isomerase
MTNPKHISIQDYTYSLPENRIAYHPLQERDESKLLVYNNGKIKTDSYRNLAKYIPEDAFLVFNDTKVIEARLLFQKPTGGVIEIFCLQHHEQYPDITTAMSQRAKVKWHCLVGGASKWKPGQALQMKASNGTTEIILNARYLEKATGSFLIELSWTPAGLSFAEILHFTGAIPLPPYIKRQVEVVDKERYQTIYANTDGSVAAPTAGLHFTENIFEDLDNIHAMRDFVTLHVGAGTFKPVKSATMAEHEMHAEWIDVSKRTMETLLHNLDRSIIAVGTTSLRTIESLYWMGLKKSGVGSRETGDVSDSAESLSQWEPYELAHHNIPVKDALRALLHWMDQNNMERLVTTTQILIAPGYDFKIVNGLITNFHQPQSTLLLLVAAFIGGDWRKVYDHALQNDFRFLSYGDGCLLWRAEQLKANS